MVLQSMLQTAPTDLIFPTKKIANLCSRRKTFNCSGVIEVLSSVNYKSQRLLLKDVWLVSKIVRNLFPPLAVHDKTLIVNLNGQSLLFIFSKWIKGTERHS